MRGHVLDTNVIIRLLNGDVAVWKMVSTLQDICISAVVIGELLFGAEKSQRREQNRRTYLDFCAPYPVLAVTQSVASEYGRIKRDLQGCGRILPENDMWIAATALASDMAVVTQDKHFSYVERLVVVPA